jgi:hypothetical protein
MTDVTSTQYRALLGLGMSPDQLQGVDTGQAAVAALPAIQRRLKETQQA